MTFVLQASDDARPVKPRALIEAVCGIWQVQLRHQLIAGDLNLRRGRRGLHASERHSLASHSARLRARRTSPQTKKANRHCRFAALFARTCYLTLLFRFFASACCLRSLFGSAAARRRAPAAGCARPAACAFTGVLSFRIRVLGLFDFLHQTLFRHQLLAPCLHLLLHLLPTPRPSDPASRGTSRFPLP